MKQKKHKHMSGIIELSTPKKKLKKESNKKSKENDEISMKSK